MPKLPNPSKVTEIPEGFEEVPESPTESKPIEKSPPKTPVKKESPEKSPQKEDTPEETPIKEENPPAQGEENIVEILGQRIEIKPTKLKYFRNKTASAYNLLKVYPLHELLTLDAGVIDEKRNGDAVVYDFLVAALDNPDFVKDNYNEFDADQVEKIVRIMGRLNHIDEKQEAARKNREAQGNR